MHPRLKRIVYFILGEPSPKAPVEPKVSTAPAPEKVPTVNDQSGEFFKEFLLQIYTCKYPFDLTVIHTKPKTRMGTYNPRTCRIRINDGWGDTERCKEDPHGKQFWQIYDQLMFLAKQKSLYNSFYALNIKMTENTAND